jgi:hypothetical protein
VRSIGPAHDQQRTILDNLPGRYYAALAMSILPRLLRDGRRRLQDVAAGLAGGDLDGR